MIVLGIAYHGLEIEIYRDDPGVRWEACRTMEIILLFFILFDLVLLEIFLLKFVKYIFNNLERNSSKFYSYIIRWLASWTNFS
jgi:hypothetical protein